SAWRASVPSTTAASTAEERFDPSWGSTGTRRSSGPLLVGHLFDRPTGDHGLRSGPHRLPACVRAFVGFLHQQPAGALALPDPGQGISAGELASIQPHRDMAVVDRSFDRDGLPVTVGLIPIRAG